MHNCIVHIIVEPVPCLAAEDETGIKQLIEYDQKTDRLIGFCGKTATSNTQHRCSTDLDLKVGDDFETLQRTFSSHQKGGYARVIILNPLHKLLPSMVVYLQCTCNKFTSSDVRAQWDQLSHLYTTSGLATALGPLIGKRSMNITNKPGSRIVSCDIFDVGCVWCKAFNQLYHKPADHMWPMEPFN